MTTLPWKRWMWIALLFAFSLRKALEAGEFKVLNDEGMVGCELLGVKEGIIGAEDIHFTPGGLAFITSDDRKYWEKYLLSNFSVRVMHAETQGGIFAFEPKSKSISKLKQSGATFPKDFHPHGLSILPRVGHTYGGGQPGGTRLYAVNHRSDGDAVEVLDAINGKLQHVRSVKSALWRNINGIAAVKDGVYVTNYMYYPLLTHPLSLPEVLNMAPEVGVPGFVLFCNVDGRLGEPCTKVAGGMRMPNGIEVSPDGKQVFIVESLGQRVSVWDVAAGGHGAPLQHKKTLYLGSVCDNLSISPGGRLLTGCHPKAMTYKFFHAKNQNFRSPSAVYSFDMDLTEAYEELVSASGNPLSGSSSAAASGGVLAVGAVHDPGFLVCPRKQPL